MIPLLPAWALALVVILGVVVVPVTAMGLAMRSAAYAAAPHATTESFWAGLLVEQNARGAVLGTPEAAPIEKSAPRPVIETPAAVRSPSYSPDSTNPEPFTLRPDMTLAELVMANVARRARRERDRMQFVDLMASLHRNVVVARRPATARVIGRHRAGTTMRLA
jgi:hypothetical protein